MAGVKAITIPKAMGDTGITSGYNPHNPPPSKVIIDSLDEDGGGRFSFTLNGLNDEDMKEVSKKYSSIMNQPMTATARRDLSMKLMREVADRKKSKPTIEVPDPEAEDDVSNIHLDVEPVHRKPVKRVPVTFFFNSRGDYHQAVYSDALIHESTLVLISDDSSSEGLYVPPHVEREPDLTVEVEGLPEPVRVINVCLTYPYEGRRHLVLAVVRDE